jgi:hypothetical protein
MKFHVHSLLFDSVCLTGGSIACFGGESRCKYMRGFRTMPKGLSGIPFV